eukprot:g885.t1
MFAASDARSSLGDALRMSNAKRAASFRPMEKLAPILRKQYKRKLNPRHEASILSMLRREIAVLEERMQVIVSMGDKRSRCRKLGSSKCMNLLKRECDDPWRFYLSDKKQNALSQRMQALYHVLKKSKVNGDFTDESWDRFAMCIQLADDALGLIKGGTCRCGRQCCLKGHFRHMPEGCDAADHFSRLLSAYASETFMDRVQMILEGISFQLHTIHNSAFDIAMKEFERIETHANKWRQAHGSGCTGLITTSSSGSKEQTRRVKKSRRLLLDSSSDSEEDDEQPSLAANAPLRAEDSTTIIDTATEKILMKRQKEREKFDEEQRIADMLVREEVRGADATEQSGSVMQELDKNLDAPSLRAKLNTLKTRLHLNKRSQELVEIGDDDVDDDDDDDDGRGGKSLPKFNPILNKMTSRRQSFQKK